MLRTVCSNPLKIPDFLQVNNGGVLMQYDAIILAGGENSSELKKIAPYDNEALIIIGQYPMIYFVYKALRQSTFVRRIVISGPVESLRNIFYREKDIYFVDAGENAIESLANAIKYLKSTDFSPNFLIAPTDIPFITREAIDDFIEQSMKVEADFYYPVTSKAVNELRFPGVTRTYVSLREGIYTGGNLFIVNSREIEQALDIGVKLVKRRKNPLAMASLLGFDLVWKFLLRRLTIEATEKRFSEVVGIRARAIISSYAEIGVDVDKPEDLELAQKYLADVVF